MQQNSGKVARNIAGGNKIKNKVFNFVTEYFLVLGYTPVVYFFGLWSSFVLSDYNQGGPKTKTEKANSDLIAVHNWLKTNKLSCNTSKTSYMTIGSRQNLANAKFMNLELDNRPIEHKPSAKLLGFILMKC